MNSVKQFQVKTAPDHHDFLQQPKPYQDNPTITMEALSMPNGTMFTKDAQSLHLTNN